MLPKVKVEVGFGHGGFRFFEGHQEKERLSSEASPSAMLVYDEAQQGSSDFTTFDVYYPYMSSNNFIQVCSPIPLVHHEFVRLFDELLNNAMWYVTFRKSSTHFSFLISKEIPQDSSMLLCSSRHENDQVVGIQVQRAHQWCQTVQFFMYLYS